MIGRLRTTQGVFLAASIIGLTVVPDATVYGGRGGHGGGGRAPRAAHVSAPRAYKAPRMSHAAAPARMSNGNSQPRVNNSQGYTNNGHISNSHALTNGNQPSTNLNRGLPGASGPHNNVAAGRSLALNNGSRTNLAPGTTTGTASPATTGIRGTRSGTSTGLTPSAYTYGSGNGARSYRAYGYGSGYRNRRYGSGYGYGRSQGNNRAIVARLRSVHASLARIDHDYQGHRVQAMHAISMAIRQLSHRSMVYSGVGFSGMNNGRGMGMRQGGRRGPPPRPAHDPGPVRFPDESGSADLTGYQYATRQPGKYVGARQGKRARSARDPRAQCRFVNPLMDQPPSVFDSLERL